MAPLPAFDAVSTLVLALAAGAALWLVLAALNWVARAVPRALEALKPVPVLVFELDDAEANDEIDVPLYKEPAKSLLPKAKTRATIPCYDPATMQSLGTVPAMTPAEVSDAITRCRAASRVWARSPFSQRRALMRVLLKHVVDNQETLCRVAARDSGKPLVDAAFGEVMTTCEKLWWLIKEGEDVLKPEKRSSGRMMFYKSARVEYHPVGVVAAIVPWNYPVHNVLNPVSAALFAGNGAVVKASEHASWSAHGHMRKLLDAALAAVGAPPDLIQIVTGYGDAGAALVSGGVDHCIFVGSTAVGRAVARAAADTLTPLTLELGGKDAFVVTDDADLDAAAATGLRGAFQSCGQNCAGAERFIVHEAVVDDFAARVAAVARSMRQGPPLSTRHQVDAGAMCMPGAAAKVAALVADAVAQGATLLAGGSVGKGPGQFMEPTVLTGVAPSMALWTEEVFGPVLAITAYATDDEAVALANDCAFGLGSAVFAGSASRARAIGARLAAGQTSVNDFATTYMCQSLPFGGVKDSGYGRFAGVEGLRGLCVAKAVAEDAAPLLIKTSIPAPLRYPIGAGGYEMVRGLIRVFYSPSWGGVLAGAAQAVRGAVKGGGVAAPARGGAAKDE